MVDKLSFPEKVWSFLVLLLWFVRHPTPNYSPLLRKDIPKYPAYFPMNSEFSEAGRGRSYACPWVSCAVFYSLWITFPSLWCLLMYTRRSVLCRPSSSLPGLRKAWLYGLCFSASLLGGSTFFTTVCVLSGSTSPSFHPPQTLILVLSWHRAVHSSGPALLEPQCRVLLDRPCTSHDAHSRHVNCLGTSVYPVRR